MNKAPITLFTYKRLDHTRRTVEALLLNLQVKEHDLIIFSDAARASSEELAVNAVRSYLNSIDGFKSVVIHHRPHNFGLSKSIIQGVSQVLSEYDRIIVLEDDMVTSPYFLAYMNEALDRFEDDERVISAHGYCYPVNESLPEAFFLRGADCWGWATWRRGWDLFNADGKYLLEELKRKMLINEFDFNGSYPFSNMLKDQIDNKNDSWAIRWHASAFLANKLTLYSGRSLVFNIGNDSSGTHCGMNSNHDVLLSSSQIDLSAIKVVPSILGFIAFENFFSGNQHTVFEKLRKAFRKALTNIA